MKIKISISIEDNLDVKLKKILEEHVFRNKSHLIEHAIESLLKGEEK